MNVTELRRALEALESEGKGNSVAVVQVNDADGDYEYVEVSSVTPVTADRRHGGDFDPGRPLVLIE